VYRKFLRPGWIVGHLMVVLAVLVCLRLGLWQWHRTHEADGTVQNLGYTILWPIFGVAFVYMWFRFLQLETIKDAEDDDELTEMAAGGIDRRVLPSDEPAEPADDSAIAAESFEPDTRVKADLTRPHVGSEPAAGVQDGVVSDDLAAEVADDPGQPVAVTAFRAPRRPPSRAYTVAVSTVGDENEDDDPELAAYNRALAALAEKDHRRAR
jgi:hypothetical protein